MVAISKSIATKIKDKQGDVTDDEVGICENIMKRKIFWYSLFILNALCSINILTSNLGIQVHVCIATVMSTILSELKLYMHEA